MPESESNLNHQPNIQLTPEKRAEMIAYMRSTAFHEETPMEEFQGMSDLDLYAALVDTNDLDQVAAGIGAPRELLELEPVTASEHISVEPETEKPNLNSIIEKGAVTGLVRTDNAEKIESTSDIEETAESSKKRESKRERKDRERKERELREAGVVPSLEISPDIVLPKHRPANRKEIAPIMVKKRDEIVPGWEKHTELSNTLKQQFGVSFIDGTGMDAQTNLEAATTISKVLEKLSESYDVGKAKLKPSNANDVRKSDGVILFNPKASEDEIVKFLSEKFPKKQVVESEPDASKVEIEAPPVVEPEQIGVPETPPTTVDLKEKMEVARIKYVQAKKSLDSYGAFKKLANYTEQKTHKIKVLEALRNHLPQETKDEVESALKEIEIEYEKARAEYVGANIERHMTEKLELLQSHQAEFAKPSRDIVEKINKYWDYLGDVNLLKFKSIDKIQNRAARFVLKSFNARNAIYGVLIYSGSYTTVATYRAISSTMGARGLAEYFRNAKNEKTVTKDQIAGFDLEQVENELGRLKAQMMFNPRNTDSISKRDDYTALVEREEQLLREIPKEDLAVILQERAKISEHVLKDEVEREKKGKLATTTIGVTAGVLAGGGWSAIKNVLESPLEAPGSARGSINTDINLDGEQEQYKLNKRFTSTVNDSETGITEPTKIDKTFRTVIEADRIPATESIAETTFHVGSRGIEGTLIDNLETLEKTDPVKYKTIVDWMHEQYPGSKASDSTLVHRVISKIAQEQGYSIDGGANDISSIESADIRIGTDGSIHLDKVDFINDVPAIEQPPVDDIKLASEQPKIETSPESPEVGPERLENEVLDFNKLHPQSAINLEPSSDAVSAIEGARGAMNFDAFYESLSDHKSSTDALKEVLGKDYKDFMKEAVNMNARGLNKIQAMPVGEILKSYSNAEISPAQIKYYKTLVYTLTNYLSENSSKAAELKQESLRKFLIRLAAEKSGK